MVKGYWQHTAGMLGRVQWGQEPLKFKLLLVEEQHEQWSNPALSKWFGLKNTLLLKAFKLTRSFWQNWVREQLHIQLCWQIRDAVKSSQGMQVALCNGHRKHPLCYCHSSMSGYSLSPSSSCRKVENCFIIFSRGMYKQSLHKWVNHWRIKISFCGKKYSFLCNGNMRMVSSPKLFKMKFRNNIRSIYWNQDQYVTKLCGQGWHNYLLVMMSWCFYSDGLWFCSALTAN